MVVVGWILEIKDRIDVKVFLEGQRVCQCQEWCRLGRRGCSHSILYGVVVGALYQESEEDWLHMRRKNVKHY